MAKKASILIIIFIIILILIGVVRQITTSIKIGSRLDKAADKLVKLQEENRLLQGILDKVQTEEYIEKQARNKLNFARPNESIVIIPRSDIDKILEDKKEPEQAKLPNWQGWLKLFFH